MKRLLSTMSMALGAVLSFPAFALDAVNTSIKLNCSVSGLYADGARIAGTGTEDISIDIRRANLNEKEPSRPAVWGTVSDIRINANGRTLEGALLKGAADRVAFAYASDAIVDGASQTLALNYELRLDTLRLKRTVMTIFTAPGQGGIMQTTEGGCVRPGAAPAASPAGPAPDWLVELRRKLKECRAKDPVSEVTCVERMQARFCTNRSPKPPECTEK